MKEAQIRDGLHVFGKCPNGRQLRDLIVAIARHPNRHHSGLTRAIAEDLGWEIDPLIDNPIQTFENQSNVPCRNVGDAIEVVEEYAACVVEELIEQEAPLLQGGLGGSKSLEYQLFPYTSSIEDSLNNNSFLPPQIQVPNSQTQLVIEWIRANLLPSLIQTDLEIKNLLRGLDGRYVRSAPRGHLHGVVRRFYPRVITFTRLIFVPYLQNRLGMLVEKQRRLLWKPIRKNMESIPKH